MKVNVDFSVNPLGEGTSMTKFIQACEEVLNSHDVKVEVHSQGTNIEGEWDEVFGAIRNCHEKLHGMGVGRLIADIRVDTRTDKELSMSHKKQAIEPHASL